MEKMMILAYFSIGIMLLINVILLIHFICIDYDISLLGFLYCLFNMREG